MSVQITGIDSLMSKLNQLGGNSVKCMAKGIQKTTLIVEGDAKDLCPVDNGDLRGSIHSKTEIQSDEVVGTVYTNKEYAAYPEYGTGQRGAESPSPPKAPIGNGYREDWAGMPAQPYMYPALMQNKETAKELCIDELNKEIRRLGGR